MQGGERMQLLKEDIFVRQAIHSRLDMQSARKDLFRLLQSRDSRLFYILSAKGEMLINGVSYPLYQDMVILFQAGSPYEWRVERADYYVVNFDYNLSYCHIQQTFHPVYADSFRQDMILDCGMIEDFGLLNQPLVLYKAIGFKSIIQNIITESAIDDSWNRYILSAMMKHLVLEILRAKNNRGSEGNPVHSMKAVIAYIQDHYSDGINNQSIAEQFGYNPTYLGKIFKIHTGTTLHEYITDLRVQAAMELLANTTCPVGEICKQVGFSDVYHFSKYFKKKVGKTPTAYRKNND